MTVSTIPFTDVFAFGDDEYEIDCELCPYTTHRQTFHACEEEVADHLAARHPRRLIRAGERQRIEFWAYRSGLMHEPEEEQVAYG